MFKQAVKRLIAGFGYHLYRQPPFKDNGADLVYELIVAHGYAPWLSDQEFRNAYAAARDHTLVDVYRAFELWSLVSEVAKLPDGDILEVGTWRGGSGCILALKAKKEVPTADVILADTFEGIVKASAIDGGYGDGAHEDATAGDVEKLAAQLEVSPMILQGVFPEILEDRLRSECFDCATLMSMFINPPRMFLIGCGRESSRGRCRVRRLRF